MNNRYPLLIAVLMFLVLFRTYAQTGSINGSVTTVDNNPLEFVNVAIIGLAKGATTDRQGRFQIKNLEAGTYTLEASFVGIKNRRKASNWSKDKF